MSKLDYLLCSQKNFKTKITNSVADELFLTYILMLLLDKAKGSVYPTLNKENNKFA